MGMKSECKLASFLIKKPSVMPETYFLAVQAERKPMISSSRERDGLSSRNKNCSTSTDGATTMNESSSPTSINEFKFSVYNLAAL